MGVEEKVENLQENKLSVFGLDELSNNYDYVVFDASAIIQPLGKNRPKNSKGSPKMFPQLEKTAFYQELSKRVGNKEPFYMTNLVGEEITYENPGVWGIGYKERYERIRDDLRLFLDFSRNSRILDYEKLSPSEKEFYMRFARVYNGSKKTKGASKTDVDLTYLAFALSRHNDKVSIVTDDSDIKNLSDSIKKGFGLGENLDVIERTGSYEFELWNKDK